MANSGIFGFPVFERDIPDLDSQCFSYHLDLPI